MTINNPKGMHEYYTETDRHWHAGSEPYTGGDSLLTALRNGWQLLNLAYRQEIQFQGSRHITIVYFQLINDSERIVMPVVENPFVQRLLRERRMMVSPMRDKVVESNPTYSNSPATVGLSA